MVNIKEVKIGKDETPNYNGALVFNRVGGGDARAERENLDPDFGIMW
jgi:hypothetical protein